MFFNNELLKDQLCNQRCYFIVEFKINHVKLLVEQHAMMNEIMFTEFVFEGSSL